MVELGEERDGRNFRVCYGWMRGVPDYKGGDGSVGGVAKEAVPLGGCCCCCGILDWEGGGGCKGKVGEDEGGEEGGEKKEEGEHGWLVSSRMFFSM